MTKPITARVISGKLRYNRDKLPHCRVQATNVHDFWVWISEGFDTTCARRAKVGDWLAKEFPGYEIERCNDGLLMRKKRESAR